MTDKLPSSSAASTASDIYLHVKTKRAGKIKGEVVAADHVDDILVKSWNWGMSQGSAMGSGQATARRAYKHLTIDKYIDSASTALMNALATNDEVKEARLAMRKAGEGQEDFFSILLGGARVVAIDIEVDEHGTPVEHVSFAFTQVEVEFRTQGTGGQAGAASTFMDEFLPQ